MGRILVCLMLMGCMQKKLERLSSAEFDHYYALKVYMDEADRKSFLKLKTEPERSAFLKENGLWDKFYQYPEHIRELIVAGDVQTGWTTDMLYMAWGAPFDKQKQPGRQATRSELLLYRFERHENSEDGRFDLVWEPNSKTEYRAYDFFRKEVIIDDNVIAEIRDRDGW